MTMTLEKFVDRWDLIGRDKDIAEEAWYAATKAALAQSAQRGEAVAWCRLNQAGKISYFDGKPMIMVGPVGNQIHDAPLYTTPPIDRAKIEAVIVELRILEAECHQSALTLGMEGLRGQCILAQRELHAALRTLQSALVESHG